MSPAIFVIVGMVCIWVVISGRARAVWTAIFNPGAAVAAGGTTAPTGGLTPPGAGSGTVPPSQSA